MIKLGYVRTSKREQHPENQILILEQNGVPRDLIFVDQGVSGTVPAEERDGFDLLMDEIKKREAAGEQGALYIFETSRLGRPKSFFNTLKVINDIESRGFMIWSLSPTEAWSRVEDPNIRELIRALLVWAASRDRANLVERTKAGLERAKGEGKKLGRPFREIPWKKVDEYLGKGLTLSAVSRLLDIPYSTLVVQNRKRKAD